MTSTLDAQAPFRPSLEPEDLSGRRARKGLGTRSVAYLAAFSVAPVLSLWSVNPDRAPELGRLLLIAGLALCASAVIALVVSRRIGVERSVALTTISLLLFFSWSPLQASLSQALPDPWGQNALAIVSMLGLVGALRFGQTKEFRLSMAVVGLVLVLYPAVSLFASAMSDEESGFDLEALPPLAPGHRRDVFFVVLDGYGGGTVLEDLYGFSNEPFLTGLEEGGFTVARNASTAYSMTYVAIPSILLMDYPVPDGRTLRDVDRRELYRIMGGDNPLIDSFRQAGYEYIHIESGWGGTRCGKRVDRCIESPFFDESVWALVSHSPVHRVLEEWMGHSFSYSSLRVLSTLQELAEERHDRPRFVFAHVLLPHAPLHVRGDCVIDFNAQLRGEAVGNRVIEPDWLELRRAAYVDQVRCVNVRLLEFIQTLGADDSSIVVLVGDHGPDSLGQISLQAHAWNTMDLRERFEVLTAVKLPSYCDSSFPEDLVSVNVFRLVLSCLTNQDISPVSERHFVVTFLENPAIPPRPTEEVSLP